MKAKVELTAESLKAVIESKHPTSLTQLAHFLGYKGSVSSGLTKKFRGLIPDIDALLKGSAGTATGTTSAAGKTEAAKDKPAKAKKATPTTLAKAAKSTTKPTAKSAKSVAAQGKWKHDPRNPFRQGSAYALCFDILAAHKDGLPREKLVALLAAATGKDAKHAAYDAQVLLSARPNEDGLNNNDSPCRHRSCRPGFWVRRENGHVKLMVD